jgi:excisionase family DNA binding protein
MRRKPQPELTPRWASLAHAAAYFDCSTDTLRRYIANGDIPGHRVGGKTLKVDLNDLDALPEKLPSRRSA